MGDHTAYTSFLRKLLGVACFPLVPMLTFPLLLQMALSFNAITHPLSAGSSGGERTLFHPFPSPKTSGERVIDVNWVTIKIRVLSC